MIFFAKSLIRLLIRRCAGLLFFVRIAVGLEISAQMYLDGNVSSPEFELEQYMSGVR
jgi:hypothetical protein